MASNRVKGITIEIGGDTTKLDKALTGVDHNLYTIQKDLQAVERRLKLDPTNTELLAQKQRLLADAVSETAKRLNTLDGAADGVRDAFSNMEIDDQQLKNFYLELELTESDLKSAEQALNKFNDELSKTDGPAGEAADGIKKTGKAANDAADGLGGIGEFARGASNALGLADLAAAGAAFTIGQKLVEGAMAAVDWLWSLDEATEEYREAMGKLNTAFETAGYDADTAEGVYEDFYRILGDTDTATEAAQLLANMGNRENELAQLTGILNDEYGALAASIPIESLIQAANEAARTGEVTGDLAREIELAGGNTEVLAEKLRNFNPEEAGGINRLKIVTDELSEALLGSSDSAKQASSLFYDLATAENELSQWTKIAAGVYGTFGDALPIEGLIEAANETAKTGKVTGVLADALNWAGINEDDFNKQLEFSSDAGYRANMIMAQLTHTYGDAADAFYENNEALIESREVQMQLDEAQAALGESVASLKNKFFELFGPALIEGMKLAAVALEGVAWVIDKIGQALDWLGQKIKDVIGFFQELFGVRKQASSVSVPEGSSTSRSALAKPYALRVATAESLPYLAQGTVTRPNSPFMAVIGDNPQEPEIVSPLSTIEQAVRNVVGSGGQPGNIRVTVNFTGSAAQLVRMLQPMITVETDRRGPQFAN